MSNKFSPEIYFKRCLLNHLITHKVTHKFFHYCFTRIWQHMCKTIITAVTKKILFWILLRTDKEMWKERAMKINKTDEHKTMQGRPNGPFIVYMKRRMWDMPPGSNLFKRRRRKNCRQLYDVLKEVANQIPINLWLFK